jgi:hypothetical protein
MQTVALVILSAAGVWLAAVGLMMASKPGYALHVLSLTASSQRVNIAEQVPRLLAGAAMVIRSEVSKIPQLFETVGLFVIASSLVLLLIPLRWHSGYAIWWSKRLNHWLFGRSRRFH